jgi:hypothetical protein
MNKYSIRLPYSYLQYGTMTGCVYAESEEEAEELAQDRFHIRDDEYEDSDGDSTDYNYENIEIELEEENVTDIPQSVLAALALQEPKVPSYYLSEINSI